MKRIFNIITGLAALVFATAACQKEDQQVMSFDQKLVGEWHLTGGRAEGKDITDGIDVYLRIQADGAFELYQKSGTQSTRYDLYTGTCTTVKGILTGVYSNGQPWGGKYTYAKTINGILLRTTNNLEEQKYESCTIPAEVIKNANTDTRSVAESGSPIL